MNLLILWTFIGYGMSTILVYGSIFENQRQWIKRHSKFFGDLIGCIMCTSTWVGFFLGLTIFSPIHTFFLTPFEYSWFFDGLLASGGVWAINSIIEWFENRN